MNYHIKRFTTVDSTNFLARKMANQGAREGTVILAEEQSAGRGRKGDYWHSRKGGLWFTIILRPEVTPGKSIILPLLTGIAVHRAVKRYGVDTRIKLPNDVLVSFVRTVFRVKACGLYL